jgi:predicted acetyltransferase
MTVHPKRAALRPEVPVAGTVRLLDKDQVVPVLTAAYPAIQPTRVGLMARSPQWYALSYRRRLATDHMVVAAHYGRAGAVDGWVAYTSHEPASDDIRANSRLRVLDFQAADQGVANDLWRFLIGVDLVDEFTVYFRPQDDPLDAMLVDAYAVRSEWDDELWLRIVNVPSALAGRTYGAAAPVVIEVVDPLLPDNAGCYRVGPDGATPTTDAPGLTMDVGTLAMIYLGAWRSSVLAATGRITVTDQAALAAADRLFAVDRPAWNGSMF